MFSGFEIWKFSIVEITFKYGRGDSVNQTNIVGKHKQTPVNYQFSPVASRTIPKMPSISHLDIDLAPFIFNKIYLPLKALLAPSVLILGHRI